jgi:hypothetical protein
MQFRSLCRWLITGGTAAVLVWLSSGCGNKASDDKLVPVTGKVTYKGEPLAAGTVVLVADQAKGNNTKQEPRGPIDNQGHFEVNTAGQPGAPPGWYRIAVLARKQSTNPSKPYQVMPSLLPKKYDSAKTSELAFQVTENAPEGAYDIVLK